ncbi:hypothetical protein, partial [Escherichia coli]|uniref:hypothetical protein n=1 Tax=Escherichia coli TaxID=562 RepID=UPI001BAEC489
FFFFFFVFCFLKNAILGWAKRFGCIMVKWRFCGGFQLTVVSWRILRFPLSESTLNFRIFLFNRTGCLCEVIHIRRVDGGAL